MPPIRRLALVALVAGCADASSGPPATQEINFDDPNVATTQAAIRSGSFAGITWDASGWAVGDFSRSTTGLRCHSAPNCLSPNATIKKDGLDWGIAGFGFPAPVVFEELWLSGSDPDLTRAAVGYDTPALVTVQLSRNGATVYTSQPILVNKTAGVLVSPGYPVPIDHVTLLSSPVAPYFANSFLIDNIKFH